MSASASPKKKATVAKPKKTPSHPTYQQMVKMAVQSLKEPKGSSKAAILKYILAHYKVGDNIKQINAHLRAALKRGVTSGVLKQVKGIGASGSFRLGEKKTTAEAKPKKRVAKPKAKKEAVEAKPKKVTKPKAKKSPKKPAAKKSPKKKASPKKTAKPKVKKSPKKAAKKSPKKASK